MIETEELINNTFIQLLLEDESRITASNISALAGISRNTFYYYYDSIEPLAARVLDLWLDGEETEPNGLGGCVTPLTERYQAHKAEVLRLCHLPYRHVVLAKVHIRLLERLTRFIRSRLGSGASPDLIMGEIELYDHVLMGFVTHWLEKNMSYDLNRFTDRLDADFNRLYPGEV